MSLCDMLEGCCPQARNHGPVIVVVTKKMLKFHLRWQTFYILYTYNEDFKMVTHEILTFDFKIEYIPSFYILVQYFKW
jgi:hypothetical protein